MIRDLIRGMATITLLPMVFLFLAVAIGLARGTIRKESGDGR